MNFKKTIKIASNIISWAVLILGIALLVFIMIMKLSGENPSLFGYDFYVIATPSMTPELEVGDFIISKKYTPGDELEVGDVVTYNGKVGDFAGKLITHKIISVDGEDIVTKGVANPAPDPGIKNTDVVSVMKTKVTFLGFIYKLTSSPWGFLLIFAVPMLGLIGLEMFDLIKLFNEGKVSENENEKEDNSRKDNQNEQNEQ